MRPGLALYGGIPRAEAEGRLAQVAFPEAQVVQVRTVERGESVGYGRTWVAAEQTRVAMLNIGYADGYPCALGEDGTCARGLCPVLGSVSMDLLAADVTDLDTGEGDWLDVDFELPESAAAAGRSQYELFTGLGRRAERYWG